MSLLKISLSISLKYLPSSPPQQTRTAVNFLKTRLFNLNVCKNHTDSNSIYDRNDIQKYLKFLESKHSTSSIASSKKIKDILNLLNMKKNVEADLKCLQEMSSDGNKELEELIEKDREMLLSDIDRLKNEIVNSIIPVDEDNNRNVELQIVPNIGGEEAKLFSQELFNMYHNYVNYKNWNFTSNPDCGYIYISGDNVYGQLRYETGVHRVQRVPETENLGRTHTSTCTVLVLPQPRPGEVVFNKKDIIIETKRSSGPGGQNVNKTESCVRVTHIPTGITIENQTSRFQYENKKLALERLEGKIFNLKQEELKNKYQQLKKQHVATNIYSDKIRTYNFNQNRVTDHRIQFTINNLKGFLSGTKELDRMVKTVREYFIQEELKLFIQEFLKSEEYKEYENQNLNVA